MIEHQSVDSGEKTFIRVYQTNQDLIKICDFVQFFCESRTKLQKDNREKLGKMRRKDKSRRKQKKPWYYKKISETKRVRKVKELVDTKKLEK
jgi:hypothetical protein